MQVQPRKKSPFHPPPPTTSPTWGLWNSAAKSSRTGLLNIVSGFVCSRVVHRKSRPLTCLSACMEGKTNPGHRERPHVGGCTCPAPNPQVCSDLISGAREKDLRDRARGRKCDERGRVPAPEMSCVCVCMFGQGSGAALGVAVTNRGSVTRHSSDLDQLPCQGLGVRNEPLLARMLARRGSADVNQYWAEFAWTQINQIRPTTQPGGEQH